MTKLSMVKPRLGGLSHRMGATPTDETARTQHRAERDSWRSWYTSRRWRKLRQVILVRDLYTCQRTGVLLIGKHPAPNSAVIDHIRPHRGDPVLFWDETNLMAVSKAFHDSQKQREEKNVLKGVWY